MPSLNVTFTDSEMENLRTAAAAQDISLKAFVHETVTTAVSEHRRRVIAAARDVAAKSAELNRRLA